MVLRPDVFQVKERDYERCAEYQRGALGRGDWELAPAYDITFTADIWKRSDDDIHSLGIYTKRCYFTEQDLISFGEDFDIPKPRNILDEVKAAVSKFSIIAQENGIPQDWIDRISEVVKTLVKE